ncbi:MAG: hypothetical protein ACPL1H_06910 [bacterium]
MASLTPLEKGEYHVWRFKDGGVFREEYKLSKDDVDKQEEVKETIKEISKKLNKDITIPKPIIVKDSIVCPICGNKATFKTIGDYDQHYLKEHIK